MQGIRPEDQALALECGSHLIVLEHEAQYRKLTKDEERAMSTLWVLHSLSLERVKRLIEKGELKI